MTLNDPDAPEWRCEMSKDRKAIRVFYGITLALSFIVECLYIKSENELLMVLLMWIPGIVGLICSKV